VTWHGNQPGFRRDNPVFLIPVDAPAPVIPNPDQPAEVPELYTSASALLPSSADKFRLVSTLVGCALLCNRILDPALARLPKQKRRKTQASGQ
jgi:hypothetical protein